MPEVAPDGHAMFYHLGDGEDAPIRSELLAWHDQVLLSSVLKQQITVTSFDQRCPRWWVDWQLKCLAVSSVVANVDSLTRHWQTLELRVANPITIAISPRSRNPIA